MRDLRNTKSPCVLFLWGSVGNFWLALNSHCKNNIEPRTFVVIHFCFLWFSYQNSRVLEKKLHTKYFFRRCVASHVKWKSLKSCHSQMKMRSTTRCLHMFSFHKMQAILLAWGTSRQAPVLKAEVCLLTGLACVLHGRSAEDKVPL